MHTYKQEALGREDLTQANKAFFKNLLVIDLKLVAKNIFFPLSLRKEIHETIYLKERIELIHFEREKEHFQRGRRLFAECEQDSQAGARYSWGQRKIRENGYLEI